jgi:hypothetical protein
MMTIVGAGTRYGGIEGRVAGDSAAARSPGQNLTWSDGIDRAAHRTRTLEADRKDVLAAPFPTSVAKKLAHDHLAERIEAARPDVSPLVDRLDPIEWPLKRTPVTQYGGSAAAVYIPDAIGILAWLFPKQFRDAIDNEIDAAGDDPAALSLEQRVAKLKQIDGDILASEREEAALSELARLLLGRHTHRPRHPVDEVRSLKSR